MRSIILGHIESFISLLFCGFFLLTDPWRYVLLIGTVLSWLIWIPFAFVAFLGHWMYALLGPWIHLLRAIAFFGFAVYATLGFVLYSRLKAGQRLAFHGTTLQNAGLIKRDGFRGSTQGMLGAGVYLSRDLKKVRAYGGEYGRILLVSVDIGKICTIDRQQHPEQKTWQNQFDAAWVPANCGMVPSGLEEFCIADESRVKLVGVYQKSQMGLAIARITFCIYSAYEELRILAGSMVDHSRAKLHKGYEFFKERQRYRDHCKLWQLHEGLLHKKMPDEIVSGLCSNTYVPPALKHRCSGSVGLGEKLSPKPQCLDYAFV